MPEQSIVEWIRVTEGLPDDGLTVLLCVPGSDEEVWLGYLDGDEWRDISAAVIDADVKWWAELPAAPE